MPASSKAVSLAPGPEDRAPGWMGPVADSPSCPDGSVSRLCIKMGGTLTSGNDEYVNLHPFPLPLTPVERGGM